MEGQRPRPWEEDESTESDGESDVLFVQYHCRDSRHPGSSKATSEEDKVCALESELEM